VDDDTFFFNTNEIDKDKDIYITITPPSVDIFYNSENDDELENKKTIFISHLRIFQIKMRMKMNPEKRDN